MLLVPICSVTAEYTQGVVCGHVVFWEMIHPCQTWSMTDITLLKWWDTISIFASLSLDHYTTDEVHGSSSWFQYPG